jgi:Family of unknown function (DUF6188)
MASGASTDRECSSHDAEPWDTVDVPHPPFIRESDGTIRQGKVLVAGQDWQREMSSEDLNFIRIDHQTRLQFGDVEMVIESPFVLTVDGIDYPLDPDDRGGLGLLLRVYPDSLRSGRVAPDGTLCLEFASGASIAVPSDPQYEAWSIVGPGNALVVCMPGTSGEFAIWS